MAGSGVRGTRAAGMRDRRGAGEARFGQESGEARFGSGVRG